MIYNVTLKIVSMLKKQMKMMILTIQQKGRRIMQLKKLMTLSYIL